MFKKKPDNKLPALFCMECFNDGKSPFYYSVCRANQSSKVRHIKAQHGGNLKLQLHYVFPRQVEAKEALAKWKLYSERSTGGIKVRNLKNVLRFEA